MMISSLELCDAFSTPSLMEYARSMKKFCNGIGHNEASRHVPGDQRLEG